MRHSIQPKDRIFVKDYGFLSFSNNKDKNIGKSIGKKLSGKYKILIMLKNLQQMHLKLLQKE